MAPVKHAAHRVSLERARAHWFAAGGLSNGGTVDVADVVSRHGHVRALGGVDSYLMLHARSRSLRREDADRALLGGRIALVPGARGCMYYVTADDLDACLRVADDQSRSRILRDLGHLCFDEARVAALTDAVATALQAGAAGSNELRRRIGTDVVPSFGSAGKKLGISTPLGPVLRLMEFDGRVLRTTEDGRLDSERHVWMARPQAGAPVPLDAALRRLVERFVQWCGPVTTAEIADWTGASQREANKALESLDVLPVAIESLWEHCWILARDADALVHGSAAHAVAFVPFEDLSLVAHGGPAPLADGVVAALRVPQWGRRHHLTPVSRTRHLGLRSILVDGRLVGFWEYDVDTRKVEFRIFDLTNAAPDAIEAAAERLGAFIGECGNYCAMSNDSEASVRGRLEMLRSLSLE